MMLISSGCGSSTGGTQKPKTSEPASSAQCDACDFLKPITYSAADTAGTIDQIINYDRIYEALCR